MKIRTNIKNKFGSVCKDIEYQMILDLLDNLIPATLDIYAILFFSTLDHLMNMLKLFFIYGHLHYVGSVKIITKHHWYFCQIFSIGRINHPFLEAMKMSLSNFNYYPVENMHSKI